MDSKIERPKFAAQRIGAVDQVEEGGKGLRFEVCDAAGEVIPAFVVMFDCQYYAYLNRCGHIAVQLDFQPGEFFSDDGQTLVCATHGAEYAPDSGACLGGPCYGVGLDPIAISERDGDLYLESNTYTLVPKPASTDTIKSGAP